MNSNHDFLAAIPLSPKQNSDCNLSDLSSTFWSGKISCMNDLTVTHEVHKLKIPLLDLTNLPPDSDDAKNDDGEGENSIDNELIEHRDVCLADELGQANDMQMHHMDAFNKVNHMRDSMPQQYQMRNNFM